MTGRVSARLSRPTPIRGRRSFEELRTHGVRARAKLITVTASAPLAGATGVRVSYAIGAAVGGAVVRNRVRRRLRALVAARPLADGSYLISASPRAVAATPSELATDLDDALATVTRRLAAQRAS